MVHLSVLDTVSPNTVHVFVDQQTVVWSSIHPHLDIVISQMIISYVGS